MSARLLCIGDLHLGRTPSRIPKKLEEEGITLAELTPAAAWRSAVEKAIALEVDAVVLAGDVVESMNQRHEAFRHLVTGVQKLVDAGIVICAVAGNHDVEALPRTARLIEGFHLLGEGGRWSEYLVTRDSRPVVRILGWSFPRSRYEMSPLAEPPLFPADSESTEEAVPLVGLLHCDLDSSESKYAPVRLSELEQIPTCAWLLGHIHKPGIKPPDSKPPDAKASDRPIGYLGSLVGLDPGEPGDHCGWLLTVDGGKPPVLERVPLAPLRWENLVVDLTGRDDAAEDLFGLLVEKLRAHLQQIEDQLESVRVVGVRVSLVGRTAVLREFSDAVASLTRQSPVIPIAARFVFIDKITLNAGVAYDLGALARGADPPGLLARDLLKLRAGVEDSRELITEAGRALEQRPGQVNFSSLGREKFNDEQVRTLLLRAGEAALDRLLSQVEEGR